MRISVIISNCPRKPTGGHKVIFEYLNYLVQNNEVSVYFGYEECFDSFPIPTFVKHFLGKNATKYFRPRWFKFDKRINKYCIKTIKNECIKDADVIIATDVKTAFPVYNLDKSKGKKYYFIQDFEDWQVSTDYVKKTYRLDMKKIVVSKWLKTLITQETGNSDINYVSNSINLNIFTNYNNPRKKHSLVFQYRSAKTKGCEYALEVIRKLKEKCDDLSVIIISNEKKSSIIPEWCEYHYNVLPKDVAKYNNKAQVFLCTTIEEGFGLPGLEAMACGCCLVSTAYTGVHEYAIDKVNALLSPIKDVDSIIENILLIFENDDLRNNLIQNGLKTAQEKRFDVAAKQFEDVLKNS